MIRKTLVNDGFQKESTAVLGFEGCSAVLCIIFLYILIIYDAV